MITLKIRGADYSTDESRKKLAEQLAKIIRPLSSRSDASPHMPNGGSNFWSVDPSGNDWWLAFDDNMEVNQFRLNYRYEPSPSSGIPSAEQALKAWLHVVLGAE